MSTSLAASRMPVLFVGHGSPMNAIEDNRWSRAMKALAPALPRPRAVLAVSAHWFIEGTHATGNDRPGTIHDFGGFPKALSQVQYPAPGDPALARRAISLLGVRGASLRSDWGLDHGAWSVLCHLLPAADVPVVELSIDALLAPAGHLALGRALAPLRDEGVLILGSGNLTHNLRHAFLSGARGEDTPEWAARFDADAARAVEARDTDYLVKAPGTDAGRLCHPTPDHYLPLLYAVGASLPGDPVSHPVTGFDMASLSMRTIRFG